MAFVDQSWMIRLIMVEFICWDLCSKNTIYKKHEKGLQTISDRCSISGWQKKMKNERLRIMVFDESYLCDTIQIDKSKCERVPLLHPPARL